MLHRVRGIGSLRGLHNQDGPSTRQPSSAEPLLTVLDMELNTKQYR